jgi:diguanylate cyclase (GGDEF)-like protein/excisionase family DNA binding protein
MLIRVGLREVSGHLRGQIGAAIRQRGHGLADDLAEVLVADPVLSRAEWREWSQVLVNLLAAAVEEGPGEDRRAWMHDISPLSLPVTLRQIVGAVHRAERVVLEELALHDQLGATSEPWAAVGHAIRSGSLEVILAFVERGAGRASLRDPLTTLMMPEVFDLVLAQEARRALRHKHGVVMILFDVDDLTQFNRVHGEGAGDRLLERLGILARRFFRTHDWVARHGDDSIAVLLPETTLDQAATLANRFRQMVQQRLLLLDHKTEATTTVTVTAAAVGTDSVQQEIDPGYFLAEAMAAVVRAQMNGGNRVEHVALQPTTVTILGAATLLGTNHQEVVRLIRSGGLTATRRGRHFHIDRAQIESLRQHRDH